MKFPLKGVNTARLSLADYERAARDNNLPVHNLRAVVKIEAGGAGFNRSKLLNKLYEYHIAWRGSKGSIRSKLVAKGLAARKWGAIKYPKNTVTRHNQLLAARQIAGTKAFEWSSYALPQMMGFNAKICGFSSAAAMVEFMLQSEANQLEVMIRFLKATGLIKHLRRGDWEKFARGYNGPGYKKNNYHRKLANAAAMYKANPEKGSTRHSTATAPATPDENVKKAQQWLTDLGYQPGEVDGWMGNNTRAAILQFQKGHPDLANDGAIGPHTMAALEKAVLHKETPAPLPQAPASTVVVGGAVLGAGSLFTSVSPWLWAAMGIAAIGVIVFAVIKWRQYRAEYSDEIARNKNIINKTPVEVAPFIERGHPVDALPLSMREVTS